jgi:hypothetical protein
MAFLTIVADTDFLDAPHWPCPHLSSCPLGHLPRPVGRPYRFGIAHADRQSHLHILGKVGTMVIQEMQTVLRVLFHLHLP